MRSRPFFVRSRDLFDWCRDLFIVRRDFFVRCRDLFIVRRDFLVRCRDLFGLRIAIFGYRMWLGIVRMCILWLKKGIFVQNRPILDKKRPLSLKKHLFLR